MWNLRSLSCLLLLCFSVTTTVAAQSTNNATTKWLTLNGDAPLVIARGGFSGLFPDSSYDAYMVAMETSLANVIAWCDVQLTKDGVGICLPDLKLDNASDIDVYFKNKKSKYSVNGVPMQGWFSIDFNFKDLAPVTLRQGVFSRTPKFDGTQQKILTVLDVVGKVKPPGLWLNIQHDTFFSQHNLSMRSFIISLSRSVIVNYISSPEVDFLKSIVSRFNPRVTKLVFRFLGHDDIEPSTNQTYDPATEYLSFIDNGDFSVDGVLSDFPITPSATIDCFTHLGKNDKPQAKLLIITSEGASGDYPGCTDLAYTKAAMDGADVLDCPVQMAKDGIPFCLGSMNLIDKTTVAQSSFGNIGSAVPELNITNGIFTFNLTWDEIKSLKPAISNPWSEFRLYRNPKARNDGRFVSLVDFLTYAKNATTVSGVMISIENAAYLAKHGFGVTAAVLEALSKAAYNNQTAKKVMIQSTDSSVLKEFKKSQYELVYRVADDISDIESSTISEIKSFASSVIVTKKSVFPSEEQFLIGQTDVVQKLQSSNLPVYIGLFNNEFVSQAWDFFSDSSVEINNYIAGAGIDGVITEFPGTAARYRRNRCLGYKERPLYLSPVEPGGLLQFMAPQLLPAAEAPNPILTESDVVEPPLPPVAKITPTAGNESIAAAPAPPSGQSSVVAGVFISCVAILLANLLIF
ncbi:PREDICTED: glycerophosphodiester phosphodiesterase GDPDL4-like isoform X2 [Nicotiana attenuata]|uniref:glycerophosphodiester phosphodiesterase GDPDL4-like isoform X2 n=1 Tax=Nicotiana attenuata TaxID=49451 RepID=UPI000905A7E5|nr:PREDICTED: glycerophosphodiester phosphodiesterase GDPDL4-like isoform X2 [Nicotiana attenuata]